MLNKRPGAVCIYLTSLVLIAWGMGQTVAKSISLPPMTAATPSSSFAGYLDRAEGALWGLFIGDALAMPVHWYYDASAIPRDYGGVLKDFAAPKEPHPSSIMSLSNTGGAGRGDKAGSIIGDVINHGKKHLWGPRGTHYHHGMAAGDNTLNAITARVVMRAYTAGGGVDTDGFLKAYVEFMTTPGSHNDAYAESYHRMFFANWVAKKPLHKCADDDQHNIASMGGMVNLPPAIVWATTSALAVAVGEGGDAPDDATAAAAVSAAGKAAVAQMYTTHDSKTLAGYAQLYGELVSQVLQGVPLQEAVEAAGKAIGVDMPGLVARDLQDTDVIGRLYSSACYIEHSMPCLLYLAYKYAGDPEGALVANTNAGGENVHRGAALGALMGAAHGKEAWPQRWMQGLTAKEAIQGEVSALLAGASGQAPPQAEAAGTAAVTASGGV